MLPNGAVLPIAIDTQSAVRTSPLPYVGEWPIMAHVACFVRVFLVRRAMATVSMYTAIAVA